MTDPSGGLSPAREAEIRQQHEADEKGGRFHEVDGERAHVDRGALLIAFAALRQERDALQASRARLIAALQHLKRRNGGAITESVEVVEWSAVAAILESEKI